MKTIQICLYSLVGCGKKGDIALKTNQINITKFKKSGVSISKYLLVDFLHTIVGIQHKYAICLTAYIYAFGSFKTCAMQQREINENTSNKLHKSVMNYCLTVKNFFVYKHTQIQELKISDDEKKIQHCTLFWQIVNMPISRCRSILSHKNI